MNNCIECHGKCCIGGDIDVYPIDEVYNDNALVTEVFGKIFDKAMIIKDGVCIALVNGLCSIYDKRPLVCRLFTVGSDCCIKFQKNLINDHKCKDCHLTKTIMDGLSNNS